jgi:hypothetical protein
MSAPLTPAPTPAAPAQNMLVMSAEDLGKAFMTFVEASGKAATGSAGSGFKAAKSGLVSAFETAVPAVKILAIAALGALAFIVFEHGASMLGSACKVL